MDECTEYGTPAANLQYTTPASTPHRVAYRMNPVKLVRQHLLVPSKLPSSQSSGQAVFPDRDLTNSVSSINPMRTKRIKCVIHPTPLRQDGVGDQSDSHRSTITEANQHLTQNIIPMNDISRDMPEKAMKYSNCLTPSTSPYDTGQRPQCNPRGDAESVEKLRDNSGQSVYYSSEAQHRENEFDLPQMLKSVAAVEQEVESIHRLVQNRLEQICDKDAQNTANQTDATDRSKKDEKRKAPAGKKVTIPTDSGNVAHGCEKKKFYDPQDIRKYMMKKKHERRAKEKEEKCKKASEQAALKRKAEVTKLFSQRPKTSIGKNHEQSNDLATARVSTNSKYFKADERSQNETKTKLPGPELDPVRNHNRRSTANPRRSTKPQMQVACDFNDIEKAGKKFEEKFNDVIAKCVSEMNKFANLDLHPSAEVTKMMLMGDERMSMNKSKEAQKSINMPDENTALPHRDSYNFLEVLKSKINLARPVQTDSSPVPFANDLITSTKAQFMGDLEKRRRLENRHSLVDSPPKLLIQPELTLSDLNSSPRKGNETFLIPDLAECGSRTFVVNTEKELKRKSPKSSWGLKENRSVGLDLSGVRPLVVSGSSIATPLAEKNVIPNTEQECKTTSEFDLQSIVENRNSHLLKDFGSGEVNLTKTSNLESLKAPNISVSLPQSLVCGDASRSLLENGIGRNWNDSGPLRDESSIQLPNDFGNITSTTLLVELYDQMIKSEDEKLCQILKKIQEQKEALNRYLKTEIFALELKKNQYRERKEDDKMKALKKKQRAVLLRVTKNILELEKMRKTVVETVEQRKVELMRQKSLTKEGKTPSRVRQQMSKPKKKPEPNNTPCVISSQTILGVSTSRCPSVILDDRSRNEANDRIEEEKMRQNVEPRMLVSRSENFSTDDRKIAKKGTVIPPIELNAGISIRLDLDPDNILLLKNSHSPVKIEEKPDDTRNNLSFLAEHSPSKGRPFKEWETSFREESVSESDIPDTSRNKNIKIKRPLATVVFSPTKRILHSRRQSSASDLTLPSWNDTTTTDQSDLEARITALQEQLTQRKLEAERLRKEEKKLRKEKLRTKEQSLIKQLEAYDQYIQRLTKLLAENQNMLFETSRPQIKHSSSHVRRESKDSCPDNASTSVDASSPRASLQNDQHYFDDAETNTEDSEKQLRKTDSGILIESEVTEVSENVEPGGTVAAVEEETRSSTESVVRVEMSSRQEAESRSVRNSPYRMLDSSSQFLQMVNDLQSEVVSISEQFYSSDFVDDIPEDVIDTKSEVSENVTNENNTSLSIEEIMTDNHSDTSERVGRDETHKTLESVATSTGRTVESVSGTLTEEIKTVESLASPAEIETAESVESAPEAVESELALPVEVKSYQLPSPEDLQRKDSSSNQTSSLEEKLNEKRVSDDQSDRTLVNEESLTSEQELKGSTSNEEFDFYNVKNISAIESLEDGSEVKSEVGVQISEQLSTQKGSSIADVIEEIRSASSLEPTSEEGDATPKVEFDLENEKLGTEAPHQTSSPVAREDVAPPQRQPTFVSEYGTEETDVSESLEYDGVLDEAYLASSDISIGQVIDFGGVLEKERSSPILDKVEATSKGSNNSREEDRSFGEIIEDHSIPNILSTTFITHEDESAASDVESTNSPILTSPVESIAETDITEDDLDTKITEGETPFLQALRRERENLIAKRRSESVDKMTVELVDNLLEETEKANENSTLENFNSGTDDLLGDDIVTRNDHDEESEITAAELKEEHPAQISHEWYDKLDLTEARLREAEELRLQQMKIEQEIEELQAQQHTPPYIYFREIPNKPPPPYTPPSGLARIPNNEYELQGHLQPIIKKVCEQLEEGEDPENNITIDDNSTGSQVHRDVKMYKQFLFDLTKEVAQSVLEEKEVQEALPWEEVSSKNVAERTKPQGEQLQKMVNNKINELFGFRSKMNREKLIIQWSRKKKTDFVDDLLIQELQEEEDDWINYEKDELSIKNQVTQSLMDELIADTVVSLQDAFQKKKQSF